MQTSVVDVRRADDGFHGWLATSPDAFGMRVLDGDADRARALATEALGFEAAARRGDPSHGPYLDVRGLQGVALDTWSALSLGAMQDGYGEREPARRPLLYWRDQPGGLFRAGPPGMWERKEPWRFRPSTCWRIGGPIVEANGISLSPVDGGWLARLDHESCEGPTMLVAAMRVLVLSCCGERVVDTTDRWVHAPALCRRFGVRPSR